MKYRYLADSEAGVVQLIAASYLRHGYYWYVTGRIPTGKPAEKIDTKLIEKYQLAVNDRERTRRKKAGIANAQYVRFNDLFIILVTEGHHKIKQPESQGGEGSQLKDCRRTPIRIGDYSISYRRGGNTPKGGLPPKWHAHVRIERRTYLELKAFYSEHAVHRSVEWLSWRLGTLPYARYAPIRRQLLNILRAVNTQRAKHAFAPVPHQALRLRRAPVKVYAELHQADSPATDLHNEGGQAA